MSWLCDVCGYENEYSDEEKNITCRCCGEPASEITILKAQKELDNYHRKIIRKAHIEELRRKQMLRQQKIDHLLAVLTLFIKAIPPVVGVSIVIALVWIVGTMHSDNISLIIWKNQMTSNIKSADILEYPEKFEANLNTLEIEERIENFFNFEGTFIENQIFKYHTTFGNNVKGIGNKNLGMIRKNTKTLVKSTRHNRNIILNSQIRLELIKSSITTFKSNFHKNWPIFCSHAQHNFQRLINSIKRK